MCDTKTISCAKDHRELKGIIHPEGHFKVVGFEHSGHFNVVDVTVFTLKCPSEGDISRLECTECLCSPRVEIPIAPLNIHVNIHIIL